MENSETKMTVVVKRPFFLTFLCLIGYTYTALFSLFFLLGVLYSSGISGILDKYLQIYDFTRLNFFLFATIGFAVFFSSFVGVLLMWKMQWLGYYIYTTAALAFIGLEVAIAGFFLPDFTVHIILILLFLIAMLFAGRKKKTAGKRALADQEVTV